MNTLSIRQFTEADIPLLKQFIIGYTSHEKYAVAWHEDDAGTTFTVRPTPLSEPYVKVYELVDEAFYTDIAKNGHSLVAL